MNLPRPLNDPGPLLRFIQQYRRTNAAEADKTMAEIHAILNTAGGKLLMQLIENATVFSTENHSEPVSALAEKNGQSKVASDLRRIASDEHEKLVREISEGSAGRRSGRRSTRRSPD